MPLALGIRAAWQVWRHRGDNQSAAEESVTSNSGPSIVAVAGVCLANGGDNIGVYVPVFANNTAGGMVTYLVVFLIMLATWCVVGHHFANRPIIARALARWGHIILPIVLIGIGVLILVEGHAFGL